MTLSYPKRGLTFGKQGDHALFRQVFNNENICQITLGVQLVTLVLYATDADSRVTDWHAVDWQRVNRYVRRLQVRIVKAVKQGKRVIPLSRYGAFIFRRRTARNDL